MDLPRQRCICVTENCFVLVKFLTDAELYRVQLWKPTQMKFYFTEEPDIRYETKQHKKYMKYNSWSLTWTLEWQLLTVRKKNKNGNWHILLWQQPSQKYCFVEQVSFLALGPLAQTCKLLRLLWLLLSLLCEFREDHATGPKLPLKYTQSQPQGHNFYQKHFTTCQSQWTAWKTAASSYTFTTYYIIDKWRVSLQNIHFSQKNKTKKKTPKNSYSVFSNHLMAVCHICSTFLQLLCRNAYSRLWILKEKKSLKISGNNLQLQPSIFFLRFTYEKKSSLCKHSNYIWWLQMLPLHLFLNIHLCVACRWEKNTHVGRRKPPSSSL